MLKVVGASWTQIKISLLILTGVTLLGILSIIYGKNFNCKSDGKYAATVMWFEHTGFRIEFWGQDNNPSNIKGGVAKAYYQPDMSTTGWATLEIETKDSYPDYVQAYASGLLEGSLSWKQIHWQWENTIKEVCERREDFCAYIRDFLKSNTEIVKAKSKAHDKTDPFWHQVHLFYIQLEGLEQGWRYQVKRNKLEYDIPSLDFLWMNVVSDIKDIEKKMNYSHNDPLKPAIPIAIVKLISNSHYVLGHASTGSYSSMLRIQKKYSFGYHVTGKRHSEPVPIKILTFTSFPGAIHSQDDFYQIKDTSDNFINVIGNPIEYANVAWKPSTLKEQVLIGPRVMTANRLTRDGKSWCSMMKKYNSGTGNKQWIHVQTKYPKIVLWIFEQFPGKTHSADETEALYHKGYWINLGLSYYKSAKETDSLKNTQRKYVEDILIKGQENVTDVDSLFELMRGPELSLAGRSDLLGTEILEKSSIEHNEPQDDYVKLGDTEQNDCNQIAPYYYVPEGVIDLKITKNNDQFKAVSGPPFTDHNSDGIAPFQWSASRIKHLPHNGHADVWNYTPVDARWVWTT